MVTIYKYFQQKELCTLESPTFKATLSSMKSNNPTIVKPAFCEAFAMAQRQRQMSWWSAASPTEGSGGIFVFNLWKQEG